MTRSADVPVYIVLRGLLYSFPSKAVARMFCGAWEEWRRSLGRAVAEHGTDLGQYREAPSPFDFTGTLVAKPLVIEDAQDARECSEILDLELKT